MGDTCITQESYDELVGLVERYPELVFENTGFEYMPPATRRKHEEQIARIEQILRAHISGFRRFYNFCHDAGGHLRLRFECDWTPSFHGVSYLRLDRFRDGDPRDPAQDQASCD